MTFEDWLSLRMVSSQKSKKTSVLSGAVLAPRSNTFRHEKGLHLCKPLF
jgi:hypothetical protein